MINHNSIVSYYKKKVATTEDLFEQVGKTYMGAPITNKQLNFIVSTIQQTLGLNKKDNVADFGCGNGLITNKIAQKVKTALGLDISEVLLDVARSNKGDNISYIGGDLLSNIDKLIGVNKIYMYEVLQHFEFTQLKCLLEKVFNLLSVESFFIGSVPDAHKVFKFYNTDERKKYFFQLLENNEMHLGNWWYREHIKMVCNSLKLKCTFIDQNVELHTAHYRFDVLIQR